MENKARFLKLVSDDTSNYLSKAEFRRKNAEWLRVSRKIAVKVLFALEHKNMSKEDLAVSIGISYQQMDNIVKGEENLTIEIICKLESALDINLIHSDRNVNRDDE